MTKKLVSEARGYVVKTVAEAKVIALGYLRAIDGFDHDMSTFGLPEVDDRFHIWRVPVKVKRSKIGEIVINAKKGDIDKSKSTKPCLFILKQKEAVEEKKSPKMSPKTPKLSS